MPQGAAKLQAGGHSQTTRTRLGGWVVGQMSTIVHVMQVDGSLNVHVDKMQERLQTKFLRIMSKKSFLRKTYLLPRLGLDPKIIEYRQFTCLFKLNYKSQNVYS